MTLTLVVTSALSISSRKITAAPGNLHVKY